MPVGDDKLAMGRNMPGDQMAWQKPECMKISQHTHDSTGDRSNGGGLGNQEPRPGIEKSSKRAVAVADIDVLSARPRTHRAQFSISKRAEEREQAANNPGKIDKPGRTHRLHHLFRHKKNAAADDGSSHNRRGMPHIQVAYQLALSCLIVAHFKNSRLFG